MKETSESQDKLLFLKAKQGDAESFTLLFDKYSKKIYRFIYFKVSSKELAEDLASQCFLKVWEQIAGGQKIKSFQAWLYRIARNLIVDYYRSREREELPLIYQEETEDEVKFDPDENLNREQLEKLLFILKSDVREIIVLRFIEELSIKEISKIVDKSSANIRVIIHRALKELQNKVK
ncbi:MAG: RNA polymerase sigma factor [Candidatus Komeilibacteria bacterium]|nr:RNA polymerase sigma factor [Candidatus Komeilibacteria bacterium]